MAHRVAAYCGSGRSLDGFAIGCMDRDACFQAEHDFDPRGLEQNVRRQTSLQALQSCARGQERRKKARQSKAPNKARFDADLRAACCLWVAARLDAARTFSCGPQS